MASSSYQTTSAIFSTPVASSTATYVIIPHKHVAECWKHFDLVLTEGVEKARCRLCGKFLGPSGNSTLSMHHDLCERKQNPETTQAQIDATDHICTYDQMLQRELQMKLVISRELPFNHFDNEDYTTYIHQGLQPKYQKVSRTTTRRDIIKGYQQAKKDLINHLNNFEGNVSLTSDVWSAGQHLNISYICITCHWIDRISWEMSKRIICFSVFELPHTDLSIYQLIMACIREFKIKDKIMSISFDNASNNTSSITMLKRDLDPFLNGEFFHTRCVCHVLNLIVQDGITFVQPIISKIKDLLIYIYHSGKRCQDFKKIVRAQGLKFLKPFYDMPIRWDSTYKMLKRAVKQKNVLMEFHNTNNGPLDISNMDWTRVEELLSILECFYNSTKTLSGVYYPTTPLVLEELYLISITLKNMMEVPTWAPVVYEMRMKILKYYEEMPQLFCCAAALNPKFGVEGVESLLECINNNVGISSEDTIISVQKFNRTLNAFYDHYDTLYGAKPRDVPIEIGSSRDITLQLAISCKKSKTISSSSELAKYKMTDFVGEQTDILEFWKTRAFHYPIMAAMARDILTVQASTVASESAFSFNGRVLNKKRSRLNP